MATTGHWYINPDGAKADFTDPSADINAAAGTVTRELHKVTTHAGSRPEVVLWKAAGAPISAGEITAAIADQDSAAVPALSDTNDAPGESAAAIADLVAVATANGSDPATTQALANALKTAVNGLIANQNAILAALRADGTVAR